MKKYKVKVIEDFELFGRRYYAGWEIEISEEVYEMVKEKVQIEEVKDANPV